MVVCQGCGSTVKQSGIVQHCTRSAEPACRAYLTDLLTIQADNQAGSDRHTENLDIGLDPTGDFFGDYAELEPPEDAAQTNLQFEDIPFTDNQMVSDINMASDGSSVEGSDDDSSDEEVDEDEALGLEPPRAPWIDDNSHSGLGGSSSGGETSSPAFADRPAMRLRGGAEENLDKRPFIEVYPKNEAGRSFRHAVPMENSTYQAAVGNEGAENPFAPFASKMEWEIAQWAKLRGPGSNAFNELMAIKGVQQRLGLTFKNMRELNQLVDKRLPGRPQFERHEVLVGSEVCEVYFRDVLACIQALFGDPDFAQYLRLKPEKHYVDSSKTERMWHDMHTGQWWWATQTAIEAEKPGATIVPVIISTDKTQLTLFRNKSAYPVYMTIGNIPKEIRRRPSSRAYVLLGYLPTTKLEGVSNKAQKRRLLANLYHACIEKILSPLKSAGGNGVFMAAGTGKVYRNHPIFAAFVGDYPEQILVTLGLNGDCPRCPASHDHLGDLTSSEEDELRDLDTVLAVLDAFDENPAGFLKSCAEIRLKPSPRPFWLHLPYVHIFRSITPDILHQLYQGVIKHLILWITAACGAAEVDARCRRLPPNHNLRIFLNGISTLSRVTGQEHDQICRFLLALVIDIRLPNSIPNDRLLQSVRAILDFLYYAQYPVHTETSLLLLEDSLQRFHENKSIFIDLNIRDNFNIPKFHFASHYIDLIKLFGTTDNFNTQYTERLHIDLAKEAYAATNRKDEFEQMTTWLERKEKIQRHEQFIKWKLSGNLRAHPLDWVPPGLSMDRELCVAKRPGLYSVTLTCIETDFCAPLFTTALRRFIALYNHPNITAARLEYELWDIHLPFRSLPVWKVIKFSKRDPLTGDKSTVDSIHVKPARLNKRQHMVPGRFDTALVNDGGGGYHGVEGYSIVRVRVVFQIPSKFHRELFGDASSVPSHLAYVEWFTPLNSQDSSHGMFKVSPMKDRNGDRICSIIPLEDITRSVHLIPKFGPVAPTEWTSSNVLDLCSTFYVNEFTDRHLFRMYFRGQQVPKVV